MRWFGVAVTALVAALATAGNAHAEDSSWSAPVPEDCIRALRGLDVDFQRVERDGITTAVRVRGKLGGVRYRQFRKKALVIDCSLAYSLAQTGPALTAIGIEKVVFSAAHQKRNIRGTNRPSQHSFGLAIDIHHFQGKDVGKLTVVDHYEKGLKTADSCLGTPASEEARVLRSAFCDMLASGMYRFIIGPDDDAPHYNHYHVEARPWGFRRNGDPRIAERRKRARERRQRTRKRRARTRARKNRNRERSKRQRTRARRQRAKAKERRKQARERRRARARLRQTRAKARRKERREKRQAQRVAARERREQRARSRRTRNRKPRPSSSAAQ